MMHGESGEVIAEATVQRNTYAYTTKGPPELPSGPRPCTLDLCLHVRKEHRNTKQTTTMEKTQEGTYPDIFPRND